MGGLANWTGFACNEGGAYDEMNEGAFVFVVVTAPLFVNTEWAIDLTFGGRGFWMGEVKIRGPAAV